MGNSTAICDPVSYTNQWHLKKNGECYRLGDTPRKSTCDPWLDPDSNKPTVKERVLRQVETPEHKHGVR